MKKGGEAPMDLSHEQHKRRLLIPHLHDFYVWAGTLWYPLLRATAGGLLLTHGWPKFVSGAAPRLAAAIDRLGFWPSVPLAYFVIFLETVGAVCIVVGLFTRFFAAAVAIEMAVIAFIAHAPRGWGAMEYPILWGVVMFAIALHGGGPYSLDRKIGREL
jgi:putative oxidoreductase